MSEPLNNSTIQVSPQELATRFAADDAIFVDDVDLESISVDDFRAMLSSVDNEFEQKIKPLLDQIPPREADFIELTFFKDKRQGDVAQIFNVSQAAVSYRLYRGYKRIRFLLSIPKISEEKLWEDLPKAFPTTIACTICDFDSDNTVLSPPDPLCEGCRGAGRMFLDVAILAAIWETSCQSDAAKRLRLSQGRVRHRFMRAVKRLKEIASTPEGAAFAPYECFFSAISNKGGKGNFNLLKEVKLPQWEGRGGNSIG